MNSENRKLDHGETIEAFIQTFETLPPLLRLHVLDYISFNHCVNHNGPYGNSEPDADTLGMTTEQADRFRKAIEEGQLIARYDGKEQNTDGSTTYWFIMTGIYLHSFYPSFYDERFGIVESGSNSTVIDDSRLPIDVDGDHGLTRLVKQYCVVNDEMRSG